MGSFTWGFDWDNYSLLSSLGRRTPLVVPHEPSRYGFGFYVFALELRVHGMGLLGPLTPISTTP